MKAIATTRFSIIVLTLVLCAVPVLGQDTMNAEKKAELEAVVDRYIASCEAKSTLLSSNSENIRRSATLACLKATYCRHHRKELVGEMLRKNIKPKPYKVRRFLSEKFLDAVPDYNLAVR
jgi:hypothetical protein